MCQSRIYGDGGTVRTRRAEIPEHDSTCEGVRDKHGYEKILGHDNVTLVPVEKSAKMGWNKRIGRGPLREQQVSTPYPGSHTAMPIQMPPLKEGRIYRRSEVESFIGTQTGTSDFDVMASHFPRNLDTWQCDLRGWRDGEEILLQYHVFPMVELKPQIWKLEESFSQQDNHRKRIEEIVELLLNGSLVYPVFMQENDPQRRIIEGMHRSVALMQIESHCIPALLAGYRNWFAPDGNIDGFEQEDEIVSGTLREAYAFFMHATCVDQKGMEIALFGGDRLRLCDESLVAKYRGNVVGVATMTVSKGRPTLSTIYVLRQFRRKGVAYRLCERAMRRFKEVGAQRVFCDVQSSGMKATLDRLGHNHPDLRAVVDMHIGFQPGEDLEMDFDDE